MRKRLTLQICLVAALCLTARAAEPMGHWPFDGHLDDVAGSINGTFSGGTPDYQPGRLSQAIRFDGVDDYVEVMVPHLTVYTITAWILPERTDPTNIIVRTSASGPNVHWSHQLRIEASGRFEHYLWDGTGRNVIGTTQVSPDAWYFVAMSASNNGQLRLFVNGQEEGTSVTVGGLWTGGDRFHIGSNASGFGWFQGTIDDVRIYEQELTEADLAAMIAEAPLPFASSPQPKNGAMLEQTSVVLQWQKGDEAVSHRVYLSENVDDVATGTVEAIQTTDARLAIGTAGGPYPAGLVPGRTYYWRVDEINDGHPESPWKGPVWSFWIPPLTAWKPVPASEGTYVDPEQNLTWNKGLAALFHTVYFGENSDVVGNATTGGMMTANPTFDPGSLQANKTYYWRVDEFAPTGTHKGEVWSFTTRPAIPVTNDPNLLLSWTFDEGPQATSAPDWSGRDKHGILVGGPLGTLEGYHGGAMTFDGQDDYLYTRTAPAMPTQTICAWVRTLQAPASILGWANAIPASATHDKCLYINADRTITLYAYDGTALVVTSVQPVADGNWHHVAAVYTSGQTIQLYVDGVSVGSTPVANIYAGYTTPHLTVGLESHVRRYLNGAVDDVRVYNKALNEESLQQLMRGDPLLAWNPVPAQGAVVEIRNADSLNWSKGETAASHDVYLGGDAAEVVAATKDSPEFQGNRTTTNLPLTGLVEFGAEYYWRIDEVEADGTVHAGNVWKFTVPDYLIVDDFESYNDAEGQGTRIYETWVDGWENDTGSMVGYQMAVAGTFGETAIVHGGRQSMPLDYNNVNAPYYSEAERTWTAAQDWTDLDADTLTLHFRGRAANDPEPLYVTLKDSEGKAATVIHPDPEAARASQWIEWSIPFSDFTGVNAARIKTMIIGLGDRANPASGGFGLLYVDNIRLAK